jgi:hypothetical protein
VRQRVGDVGTRIADVLEAIPRQPLEAAAHEAMYRRRRIGRQRVEIHSSLEHPRE